MNFTRIKSKSKSFTEFLKNNVILIIALGICIFLVFYNLGEIEFWGEDEAQTLLYASRFIIGLKNHSLSNATSIYSNATLSLVMLVQVPFILLFGVCELASRMPAAIVTVLTLFVIYKIGLFFLDRKYANFLAILYAVSGAVGLFKSSIGVGFYIFFILLGFYNIEKYFYAPDEKERGKFLNLQAGLIFVVLSLISVLDAYFFVPFFVIILLINFKKIGVKKFFLSLITPVVLFLSFIYFEFILARKLTGMNNATYEHFVGRKGTLELTFNFKEFIQGLITSYSIYFVVLFAISLLVLVILVILRKIKIPGTLIRVILLFSLHFFIWMFLMEKENGHLMNSYPVMMLIIAYACQSAGNLISENKYFKNGIKAMIKPLLVSILAVIICFNFYHTFIVFNNLSPDKEKYPGIYTPGNIPAGYVWGHKLGIKSAAYLLREDNFITGGLVSHYGSAFNFIYMGGEIIVYSSSNAIEYMMAGEDIVTKYKIRYVGLSPDFHNKEYLEYIDSKGFKKIIITHKGEEIYYIYDVLKTSSEVVVIDRDQYDREYNKKYTNIDVALPYFNTF
jgi:4-amino-4-deoxy-L-arabinose transferase-like glycosyltransferase